MGFLIITGWRSVSYVIFSVCYLLHNESAFTEKFIFSCVVVCVCVFPCVGIHVCAVYKHVCLCKCGSWRLTLGIFFHWTLFIGAGCLVEHRAHSLAYYIYLPHAMNCSHCLLSTWISGSQVDDGDSKSSDDTYTVMASLLLNIFPAPHGIGYSKKVICDLLFGSFQVLTF